MVWEISQDTPDGKFSKQLQQATGYKSKGVTTFNNTVALGGGVFMETTESEANADVSDDQCRWTNCVQTCPSGWSAVKREDPYRKSNKELFLDGTGCGGNGIRTFCCPPGKQPFCQWLFHNNGKCTPGCPDRTGDEEMWEVASTSAACNNGKAQVACCRGNTRQVWLSTVSTSGMAKSMTVPSILAPSNVDGAAPSTCHSLRAGMAVAPKSAVIARGRKERDLFAKTPEMRPSHTLRTAIGRTISTSVAPILSRRDSAVVTVHLARSR